MQQLPKIVALRARRSATDTVGVVISWFFEDTEQAIFLTLRFSDEAAALDVIKQVEHIAAQIGAAN